MDITISLYFPTWKTERLIMRPFDRADAVFFSSLMTGDVARTLSTIPFPFDFPQAMEWICRWQERCAAGQGIACTVIHWGIIIGAVTLECVSVFETSVAELRYWYGRPYWGRGFATEAAYGIATYAFVHLGVERLRARHLVGNGASGRVLTNIGMRSVGIERNAVFHWNAFHDVIFYSMQKDDLAALPRAAAVS